MVIMVIMVIMVPGASACLIWAKDEKRMNENYEEHKIHENYKKLELKSVSEKAALKFELDLKNLGL